MITFAGVCEALYTEKKSKFLAAGQPIGKESDAADFLEIRRKLYRDARHHVYALRFGMSERYSDDGEPAGTAGLPVLNLLRQERIENAVVVVTRYFGGILLGAGGLTRAYSRSAKLLLEKTNLIQKVRCQKISLAVSYSLSGKIKYWIESSDVLTLDILYAAEVTFLLLTRLETVGSFIRQASEILNGREGVMLLEEVDAVYPFSQRA